MRYARAPLRHPPPHLIAGDGDLDALHVSWIQADKWWIMVLYEHEGIAYVNAVAHHFRPGTLLIFPPGSRGGHPVVGRGTRYSYFQFMLQEDDRDIVSLPIRSDHDELFVKKFTEAVPMINMRFPPVQAFVWNLLWNLAEHPRMVGADDKLLDAEGYIATRLSSPLTVLEVCEAVGVPYRTLARMFEVEHGMGIHRYLTQMRAREAVRLLCETMLPIKVIAAKVGVPDPHQFNKLVRRSVGLSPRSVREQGVPIPGQWSAH